ncbi:MAG: CDP-glycerol glycerophosphotransferase family protein [Candidatus Sabulitectum sp.]|nr:CDP-glycerol glycerophosphotransferase family protein [Candidatus Sabulitectum sp.]
MRLLFYVSKLYSIPVILPLLKEAERQNIETALYASAKVKKRLPEILPGIRTFTELKEAVTFQPDFVLCPGNFVDFRLPGIKVELFHGIGIEKPSHYRIRHFFDVYLTSGPVVTEEFKRLQKKHGYFSVFETGWPKIDHILSCDTTKIREQLKLPIGRKIVLYAPTHSSTMESAGDIVPVIETIMKKDEIWFCKPHEFMKKETLDELGKKRIRLIDSYDITPYLHLADVLISDTSSVIYEFMVLDKPVVTYRTMSRKDKGINTESIHELRDALDRSLLNPGEYTHTRHRHLSEVNPKLDGKISKGIMDILISIEQNGLQRNRRKPFNLFRKLQILYHSRFRKGYLR